MSQSIWTRCAGSSSVAPLAIDAWRVVESQVALSTRKLVDSDAEQELLEDLLERVKPPVPPDSGFAHLHFLLYTPFRHPPLRRGSRFGTHMERGLWYGSRVLPTALAEVAYYRFLFLDGTAASLGTVTVELSAFQAKIRARRAVDLTVPPFAAHRGRLGSKVSYAASQQMGREMRAAGVEAFLYQSVRDPQHGQNVGLFVPAFGRRSPTVPHTWTCTATRARVEFSRRDVFRRERLAFERRLFEVGGTLPAPAFAPTG